MSGNKSYAPLFQFDAYQGVHSPTHMLMSAPGGSGFLQSTDQVRSAPQGLTTGSHDLSVGYGMETGNMLAGVSHSPHSADPCAQSVPPSIAPLPSSDYIRYHSEAASSPYGIRPGMPPFHAPLQFGSIHPPAPFIPPPIIHTASHEEDADCVQLEPANDITCPQGVTHLAASTRMPEVTTHASTYVPLVPLTHPPPSRCATRASSAVPRTLSPVSAPVPVQIPGLPYDHMPTPPCAPTGPVPPYVLPPAPMPAPAPAHITFS
ncbi:hypothetical protein FRC11_001734, partial [Ceratobasidium sp. 423]